MATKIQGGAATKAVQISGRRLMGGAAIPIVIVTDDDPRPTIAGAALPLQILKAGDRPMMGGAALPVRIVEPTAGPVRAGAAMPAIVVEGALPGGGYRKQIPITGQAGAGTDYQVRLEVYPGSGIDSDGVVYLGGHSVDFPNDIQFTAEDGETVLDHWLEEYDIENDRVTFWIEIQADLGSNQNFYIYYGPSQAGLSDGDATFPFFDDFEGVSLDLAKWEVEQGSVALESLLVPSGMNIFHVKPAAQYHSGTYNRTYFVYLTTMKKVQIRYYDHDSDVVSSPTTLHTFAAFDEHNAPAILILADGKIVVVYSAHNGALYSRKSTNPEDISAWDGEVTIEVTGTTYPQPILLSNGDLWVFYRYNVSGTHKTCCYKVSGDDGDSWGGRNTLVDFGNGYWIYHHVVNGGTTIHLAWMARTEPGGDREDVYYIYSPDNGSTWRKRDGTAKTPPIDSTEADLVYDTPVAGATVVNDIQLDGSNNPYIVFTDDADSDPADGRFAFYDGAWETHFVCDIDKIPGGRNGGLCLDRNDIYKIYAGVPDAGKCEIQEWTSVDGGDTWGFSTSITDASAKDHVVPMVVKDYISSFKLIWVTVRHYTSAINCDLFLQSYPSGLSRSLELAETTGVVGRIEGKTTFSSPKAFEARAAASLPVVENGFFLASRQQDIPTEVAGRFYGDLVANLMNFRTTRGGVNEETLDFDLSDIVYWRKYQVIWGGLDDAKGYVDDVLKATHTTRVTSQDQVIFLAEGSSQDTGVVLLDWLFVRKYNDPEPVVGTAGAEEEV